MRLCCLKLTVGFEPIAGAIIVSQSPNMHTYICYIYSADYCYVYIYIYTYMYTFREREREM